MSEDNGLQSVLKKHSDGDLGFGITLSLFGLIFVSNNSLYILYILLGGALMLISLLTKHYISKNAFLISGVWYIIFSFLLIYQYIKTPSYFLAFVLFIIIATGLVTKIRSYFMFRN